MILIELRHPHDDALQVVLYVYDTPWHESESAAESAAESDSELYSLAVSRHPLGNFKLKIRAASPPSLRHWHRRRHWHRHRHCQ